MIQLKVVKGAQQGTVFNLQEEPIYIGRSRTNDVILYDEKVSGRHASLTRSAGRILLRDLGSTNGTFLNTNPVDSAVVKTGDLLRLGDTVMTIKCHDVPVTSDGTEVRVVQDKTGGGPTIHETVRNSEGSTIFNVSELTMESLRAAHRNLMALYQVNGVLNSTFDLSKLFERIMDQIFKVTRAGRAVLMVFDDNTKELQPKSIRTRDGRKLDQLELSHTIVNEVLNKNAGILTSDAMSDDRFSSGQSVMEFHIRSAMCVPIRSKEKVTGIIYVDNETTSGTFKRSDLELLTALGNEAGVAIENTKLYEANLRAERLAAMGEALAGLSHYIKNILMCMQGGGQLVQRALDNQDFKSLEKGWNIVRRNERKLSGLVMDMLSYCKERQPIYDKCNLREVVEDIIEMNAPLLEEKSVTVEHNLNDFPYIVIADAEGLNRCLLNIFANAVDAIDKEAGKIEIKASKDNAANEVILEISDNGCGIPADILPNIFEAFCSTKGSKGTGLGLAVSSKIIKEHGGKIEVESERGKGTTFTVKLPAEVKDQQDSK